jgi:hypothetical protein
MSAVSLAKTSVENTLVYSYTEKSNIPPTSIGMMSVKLEPQWLKITTRRKQKMKAEEIAIEIAKSPLTIEQKLSWHFANFEPVIPEAMIPVCAQAIDLSNKGKDLDVVLDLPEEASFQNQPRASAKDIIEGLHLSYYLGAN